MRKNEGDSANRDGVRLGSSLRGKSSGDRKTGRPVIHVDGFHKQNVMLTTSARNFLEDTYTAMRYNARKLGKLADIDRSKIIRGILLGIKNAGLKLEDRNILDEQELTDFICHTLQKAIKRGLP